MAVYGALVRCFELYGTKILYHKARNSEPKHHKQPFFLHCSICFITTKLQYYLVSNKPIAQKLIRAYTHHSLHNGIRTILQVIVLFCKGNLNPDQSLANNSIIYSIYVIISFHLLISYLPLIQLYNLTQFIQLCYKAR